MKMKVSFWYEGIRYSVIFDSNKCRFDEFLYCLDEQYPKEETK